MTGTITPVPGTPLSWYSSPIGRSLFKDTLFGAAGYERRTPPLWWRLRNRLRMTLTGEALIPAVAWLLRRVLPRGFTVAYGELRAAVVHESDRAWTDYGVVGRHLVTTAGKNYLAACFDNTSEPELLKYHAFGTGTNAAAAGDTALQAELSTQYASANVRPTGSQAHSANTYTTAATLTPSSGGTINVTEWMLTTQAATGGGTCFDRQVFTAVPVVQPNGDSLTTTYTYTIN